MAFTRDDLDTLNNSISGMASGILQGQMEKRRQQQQDFQNEMATRAATRADTALEQNAQARKDELERRKGVDDANANNRMEQQALALEKLRVQSEATTEKYKAADAATKQKIQAGVLKSTTDVLKNLAADVKAGVRTPEQARNAIKLSWTAQTPEIQSIVKTQHPDYGTIQMALDDKDPFTAPAGKTGHPDAMVQRLENARLKEAQAEIARANGDDETAKSLLADAQRIRATMPNTEKSKTPPLSVTVDANGNPTSRKMTEEQFKAEQNAAQIAKELEASKQGKISSFFSKSPSTPAEKAALANELSKKFPHLSREQILAEVENRSKK